MNKTTRTKNLDPSIMLVEGPPGTGKSYLISNLALQMIFGDETHNLNLKILICSGSNAAVDTITEKLLATRKKGLGLFFDHFVYF